MAKVATATKSAEKPNFGSILDRQGSEIEKPKPTPVGSYTGIVQGQVRYDKSSKKQTEFAEFTIKFVSAGEDVDADDLEAMGGIEGKTIKATYYLTEDAVWRLKEFLANCGIDVDNMSLREAIEEAPNCEIGFSITHEASADGQSLFARFGKTYAVEA